MDKKTKKVQTVKTYNAFMESPKTMLEVAKETGIMRASICRYVATFRKHKKIVEVRKGLCSISKHEATFYSTDPEYFKPELQTEIFQEEGCRV